MTKQRPERFEKTINSFFFHVEKKQTENKQIKKRKQNYKVTEISLIAIKRIYIEKNKVVFRKYVELSADYDSVEMDEYSKMFFSL